MKFRLPIIDRYFLSELLRFFLFSVGLLSALGVAIGTISDLAYKISEYDLPIAIATLIFIYKIPEYIAYALPISVLLTTLIVYGRLNSDREIIALGSVGVNMYRIIAPALAFSLAVTILTFILNESVVPYSNYQANLIQNPFIPKTELNLQRQDIFYHESEKDRLNNIYYAESFNGREFSNITILIRSQGRLKQIVTASAASWNEEEQVWELSEGEINRLGTNIATLSREKFARQQLALPKTIFSIVNLKRSPDDMNIEGAKRYLRLIRDRGQPKEIALFEVRIQQKIAFPFICSAFAAIGSSIGIGFGQINKSRGFGLCVAIVFIYYLIGFTSGALGIVGLLTPTLAAWLPNFLCLLLGMKLLTLANS